MAQPLARGALDNTLAQTAFAWLEGGSPQFVERDARGAFEDFVDAYVYVGERLFPTPADVVTGDGVHEPLITLWQDGATHVRRAASVSAPGDDDERQWQRFVGSIGSASERWSHWTRFQWTQRIVPASKARFGPREEWKADVVAALERVREAAGGRILTTPAPVSADASMIQALVERLSSDLAALPRIDPEYEDLARRERVSTSQLACAYAWSWFRRGACYSAIRSDGVSARFHVLRDAAVPPIGSQEWTLSSERPVPWGEVVAQCVEDGVVERDSIEFARFMRELRRIVQASLGTNPSGDFADCLRRARAETGETRQRLTTRAIGLALVEAKCPPKLKEDQVRRRVVEAAARAAEVGVSGRAPLFAPFAYEFVSLALHSSTARAAEYRWRARRSSGRVWKVFRKNPEEVFEIPARP